MSLREHLLPHIDIMNILHDTNYKEYALSKYDNQKCSGDDEFLVDLEERPRWIKRLLRRYNNGGELRELLILNHIIGFYNTFPGEAGTKLLFYKMDEDLYPALKSFIIHLEMEDYNIKIHDTWTFRTIKADDIVKQRLEEREWEHQR